MHIYTVCVKFIGSNLTVNYQSGLYAKLIQLSFPVFALIVRLLKLAWTFLIVSSIFEPKENISLARIAVLYLLVACYYACSLPPLGGVHEKHGGSDTE